MRKLGSKKKVYMCTIKYSSVAEVYDLLGILLEKRLCHHRQITKQTKDVPKGMVLNRLTYCFLHDFLDVSVNL